ncbi:MAG: TrbC/VirB2 family protein [Candidatus Peribacteraceae bacterium]|nr:TrbC/VirB2 family protein [Candidatus Peribacteraceae bacterium]
MKKIITSLSTAVALSQFYAIKAMAALAPPECPAGVDCSPGDPAGIRTTIVNLLKIVLDFITLIAVIYVIIAGIRLIVSGGDEGEKDKAKKTIIYVIVGILVVLFARVIVTFFAGITAS